MHEATVKALKSPEIANRLESVGLVAVGDTPAEYSAFIEAETEKRSRAIKASGASSSKACGCLLQALDQVSER